MLPDFLKEKYDPIKLLSRSHTVAVYLAIQKLLERKVVIKILALRTGTEDKAIKRFEREGKILAQLDDPGVVKIFDFGKEQDIAFIVSEFVEGKSLAEFLTISQLPQGGLEIELALRIIKEIAKILARVHKRGILHRDIKPSNIIIKEDGSIKLIDFGLAQTLSLENITLAGEVIGTPAYMSPEQISGKPIDFRSDIFSLGVVAYELLTGKNPFVADTLTGVLNKVLNHKPKLTFSTPVADLIGKMLEKNPEKRFDSCETIVKTIDPIITKLTKPDLVVSKKRILPRVFALGTITVVLGLLTFYAIKTYINRKNIALPTKIEVGLRIDTLRPTNLNKPTDNFSKVITNSIPNIKSEPAHQRKVTEEKQAKLELLNDLNRSPAGRATDTAFLRLSAEPWVNIYLNDKFMGQTPIAQPLKLVPGITQLKLSNPNIGDWETLISAKAKETLNIFVDLTKRFAGLWVSAEPWAKVYIQGVERGTTPIGRVLYLSPGIYEITFEHPNYPPVSETVSLKLGETETIHCDFLHRSKKEAEK